MIKNPKKLKALEQNHKMVSDGKKWYKKHVKMLTRVRKKLQIGRQKIGAE